MPVIMGFTPKRSVPCSSLTPSPFSPLNQYFTKPDAVQCPSNQPNRVWSDTWEVFDDGPTEYYRHNGEQDEGWCNSKVIPKNPPMTPNCY
jgi:hypothetical protein